MRARPGRKRDLHMHPDLVANSTGDDELTLTGALASPRTRARARLATTLMRWTTCDRLRAC
jgi:hypothetical protein